MDLELDYDGFVPSHQGGHSEHKQKLRMAFSEQLRRHWTQQSDYLWNWYSKGLPVARVNADGICDPDPVEPFFKVELFNYWMIPLASYRNNLSCRVDVKILRRKQRSRLVQGRADLDNQLKLVQDALKMPKNQNEVPGNMYGHGDEMFVLVEDDSLITRSSVEGVPRLDYSGPSPSESDPEDPVKLRVSVSIRALDSRHPSLLDWI